MIINIKRSYEPAEPADGYRVFVDRLWPRGLSHATFHYDEWVKTIAPSDRLRQWFHVDPDNRWPEFAKRYAHELEVSAAFAGFKHDISRHSTVTLLYSSHDALHNNAVVVRSMLEAH